MSYVFKCDKDDRKPIAFLKGKSFDLVVVGAGQYVEKLGMLPGHQGHPVLTASRVHTNLGF
jgi:hypothetical protein